MKNERICPACQYKMTFFEPISPENYRPEIATLSVFLSS